jgi:hypothetical protein
MARRWAREHGKSIVGNGDIHRLRQLGKTYSLVDAAPEPNAICEAIKAGNVEARTTPLSTLEAATHLADLVLAHVFRSPRRKPDTLVRSSAPEASTP